MSMIQPQPQPPLPLLFTRLSVTLLLLFLLLFIVHHCNPLTVRDDFNLKQKDCEVFKGGYRFNFYTPGIENYEVSLNVNGQSVRFSFQLCGLVGSQRCEFAQSCTISPSGYITKFGSTQKKVVVVHSGERIDFIYNSYESNKNYYSPTVDQDPFISHTILLCDPQMTSAHFEGIQCSAYPYGSNNPKKVVCVVRTSYACADEISQHSMRNDQENLTPAPLPIWDRRPKPTPLQLCQEVCGPFGYCDTLGRCQCTTPSYKNCTVSIKLKSTKIVDDYTMTLVGDFGKNSTDLNILMNGQECKQYYFTEHVIHCKLGSALSKDNRDMILTFSLQGYQRSHFKFQLTQKKAKSSKRLLWYDP